MKSAFPKTILLLLIPAAICSFYAFNKISAKDNTGADKEKGIIFIEQDWNKALQKAGKEKKLVFLDIYATWCGPCKMLKKNTFTNEKVGKFFNANFVNVTIDGERGIGPELATRFSLEGYPTLIVTDSNGQPLLYTVGYLEPDYLLEFAKEALLKK